MALVDEKLKFAVFIDYDNIEIGVKTTLNRELDIESVLEGIKQRGEIVAKIAYGNWGQQGQATRRFMEYGVQMVQRDSTPRGDKNGADINLALDALEMAFTRDHINAFAIVSGDSDFMALVNKLKQFNKRVYIVGGKQFTSSILQRNCHEFISYESLLDILPSRSRKAGGGRQRQQTSAQPISQALELLDRALSALEVRGAQPQLGLLKSTMQQLDPAFSERDYGARSFSSFAEQLVSAGFAKVRTRGNQRVLERIGQDQEPEDEVDELAPETDVAVDEPAMEEPAAEKAAPEPPPAEEPEPVGATRDHALAFLREVLLANEEVLAIGIPEREIEALTRAVDSDFDETAFGFANFGELLGLSLARGLLTSETDRRNVIRYFAGDTLEDTIDLPEPTTRRADSSSGSRPARRRRRGGRGRGGRRPEYSDERPSAEQAPPAEPERSPEPEPAPAPSQAQPKPAVRKAAKKKRAVKKAAKKKAAKKRVARKPDESSTGED